jgi:cobalamin biosynthetic protein CobC
MRHGGDLSQPVEAYGIAADDWLDLSTGINPHPYTGDPDRDETTECPDRRLPDPAMLETLLTTARAAYDVPDDLALCAAPGSEILIRIQPWLMRGDTALLPTTYRSYREAWASAGGSIELLADDDFDALPATTSIALVNPNNPDDRWIDLGRLMACARSRRGPACLIVDEAYADAHPDLSLVPHLRTADPAIVLKSFGKFYGLPGLRLGFAVGAPELIRPIAAMLGDWPVSASALRTGCAALADTDWRTAMRQRLADEAARLDTFLASAGLEIVGGTALFRLVSHPSAQQVQDHLARSGIWVRIFDEAPDLIRIGLPGGRDQSERLRQALADLP